MAERLYPTNRMLAADGVDTSITTAGEHHWWDGTGKYLVKLPYAITAQAVQYFVDRIDSLEDVLLIQEPVGTHRRIGFLYRAVSKRWKCYETTTRRYRGVYVVSMALYWSDVTDSFFSYSCRRTVVISDKGRLLEVIGDGDGLIGES